MVERLRICNREADVPREIHPCSCRERTLNNTMPKPCLLVIIRLLSNVSSVKIILTRTTSARNIPTFGSAAVYTSSTLVVDNKTRATILQYEYCSRKPTPGEPELVYMIEALAKLSIDTQFVLNRSNSHMCRCAYTYCIYVRAYLVPKTLEISGTLQYTAVSTEILVFLIF